MSGLSGAGIDKALYPNPYAGDEKASGAYGRRAGAATGSPGGAQAGGLMAQRDMRDRMALQRIQAQTQQGQAYGQMFQQMAMLAAYFKHQQGAGNMQEPGTDTMPQQQGERLVDPNFGFLNPNYRPNYTAPLPQRPYHEPEY